VSEPRDLTDLVPNEVRAELAVAVAVLEQHGPAIPKRCGSWTRPRRQPARRWTRPSRPKTNGGLSSARPASTVAGRRPTGWCQRLSRLGRVPLRGNA
jgi:hypothetical protein